MITNGEVNQRKRMIIYSHDNSMIREVGQRHSTEEAGEQTDITDIVQCGIGGGKGVD